ncbi:MAG: phage holin family protein [Myxococcota bacterium]
MITLLAALLLKGLVVLGISRILPGVKVKSYGTGVAVAAVYGLLSAFLLGPLKAVTFPLIVMTAGLFVVVLNAFLLWVTDQLLEGFRIKGWGSLFLATIALSIGDALVWAIVHRLI